LSQALSPSDEIEIAYAGIDLQAGNLRDSDPYQALTAYEDLDRNDGGVFFYPRKDNASLRPRQEPKDAAGNVIYGQKYPLYNFCVAFYKKLSAGDWLFAGANHRPNQDKPEIYVADHTLIVKGVQAVKVEIFDMAGKCVERFPGNTSSGKFALNRLHKGIYIGKITTNEESYSAKIAMGGI
jgi:hypothetical protein